MPRKNLNSSRLIRFLADLSIVDAAESKQAFAERLGQWLDFSDAIILHAAHTANPSAAAPAGHVDARVAVEREFVRIRTALTESITTSCSPEAGATRIKWPTPKPGAPIDCAALYAPYQRFYVAHQGEMELSIRPLRASLRKALAHAAPRLERLAALDAALDKILSGRERQLLATVPVLLEKRFEHLLRAHQQTLAGDQSDDPARWMQPGGWLADFGKELQGVLLAELDLRLQPTVGLIEAFSNEAA